MARQARVHSIDALQRFRGDLLVFIERVQAVLDEARSHVNKTIDWLQHDRLPYWQGRVKKLTAQVADARNNLIGAKMFKSKEEEHSERRRLALLEAHLEEAERKVAMLRKLAREFEAEARLKLTQCHQLAGVVDYELPKAVEYLRESVWKLEEYAELHEPPRRSQSDDEMKKEDDDESG